MRSWKEKWEEEEAAEDRELQEGRTRDHLSPGCISSLDQHRAGHTAGVQKTRAE